MQGSKIRLSPAEAALICDAELILTKNSIIQKAVALLAELQNDIQTADGRWSTLSTPKISKGENYRGLPYVVLDYPRLAAGEDLLFIRSMFWWGHYFSSTLHVAGQYKKKALGNLVSAFPALAAANYFVGINRDPWQHHFGDSNYQPLSTLNEYEFSALLQEQSHIKIAAKWSLADWDEAANRFMKSWQTLAALVA